MSLATSAKVEVAVESLGSLDRLGLDNMTMVFLNETWRSHPLLYGSLTPISYAHQFTTEVSAYAPHIYY